MSRHEREVLADKTLVYLSSVAKIRSEIQDVPEDAELVGEIVERATATYRRLTGREPDLLDPSLFD